MKRRVYDLYCGLGGWSRGFIAEGYEAIGFDIERHQYGEKRYPGQLVLQDARTLHGSQFRDGAAIVASPPLSALLQNGDAVFTRETGSCGDSRG